MTAELMCWFRNRRRWHKTAWAPKLLPRGESVGDGRRCGTTLDRAPGKAP